MRDWRVDGVVGVYDLDDVDRRLLTLLQEDARYTATALADELDVSDNTVHNRMDRLEGEGVVEGYTTRVDPAAAGLDRTVRVTCTAPLSERSTLAADALDVTGVVEVAELPTGRGNLVATVLAGSDDAVEDVTQSLSDLGLTVDAVDVVVQRRRAPLDLTADRDPARE